MRSRPLSISDATARTQGFLRAELRLVLPVALAFMGLPAIAMELLVPPAATPADVGPTLLYALPVGIAAIAGSLTISALALVPGISVAEALRIGVRRLPALIAAVVLAGLCLGGIAIVVATLLAVLGIGLGVSRNGLAALMMAAMALVSLFVSARLCLVTAVIADRPIDPVSALRRSWQLTKGQFGRLAALILLVLAASVVVSLAVQSVSGVIAWTLGKATGVDGLMRAVVTTVGALISAIVSMLFAVLLAAVYRQLEAQGASRGI